MQRINEDIKTGNFKQIYLLYGEERYLKNQYTTRLRKALCQDGDEMNTHFYQGKDFSLGQVIDLAETLPFLAERRVMFFKDTGLFKAGGEKLAEYLANPNDTTFFVFTESEVDKRSKLYKTVQFKGYVARDGVEFQNVIAADFFKYPCFARKVFGVQFCGKYVFAAVYRNYVARDFITVDFGINS